MSWIDPLVPVAAPAAEEGSPRRRAVRFASVLAAVAGGAGALEVHRGRSPRAGVALLLGAGFLVVWALVQPRGVLAFRRGWFWVGERLGRVNSVILLTVLYVAVVTPLGLALRVLRRSASRSAPGFSPRDATRDAKRFEHPY